MSGLPHKAMKGSILGSALACEDEAVLLKQTADWMNERARASTFRVDQIPFSELDKWSFDASSGDLSHQSGKFFRIEGLHVATTFRGLPSWEQPIINQPEIGILGILMKRFDGMPHFLMQVKMEPGNINLQQISPTVQATKSNYTQAHAGKLPAYLEYFLGRERHRVIYDQLQSEQGGRFLRKRNRNIVLEVTGDLDPGDDFRWFTLGQLKQLLQYDNLVNMDARTVISCLPLLDGETQNSVGALQKHTEQLLSSEGALLTSFGQDVLRSMCAGEGACCHSTDEIISWITTLKCTYDLATRYVPLKSVAEWRTNEHEISHCEDRHFSVIAVRVEAGSREVTRWTQPLLKDTEHGLIGFLCQRREGIIHFLVGAKVEPGNFDILELGPTVSCARYQRRRTEGTLPPFAQLLLEAPASAIRHRSLQSDEGGRFYHFQNQYLIVEIDPGESVETGTDFRWMTLRQIMGFMRFNNYFNIEARGLLSCLSIR